MRNDCRICHGTSLDLVLQLEPTPIGDEFLIEPKHQPLHPIDLYQCQDCGLAQLLYEIPPEEIYKDYIYLTGSSPGLQQHFEKYAKDVSAVVGLKEGDLVVDIGSNDGTLLKSFKRLGMQVCGFEPANEIAAQAQLAGIPSIPTFFAPGLAIGWPKKPRLITANNVVANVNDLDSFMQGVVELLADDGTFVFESFYLGDVIGNMVFDFIYHEHLSAFSIRPVKKLMERYGLLLTRVDHLKTKGGSIRYYCNRYYAERLGSASGYDYDYGGCDPEMDLDMRGVSDHEDAHLYEKRTWLDFNKRIAVEREKTHEFCRKAKAEGKTIAGFGACISGTTLMYHFRLGDFLSYIVDDNPAKIGRISPGKHLRVQPTGHLEVMKPDYVLALAWRFADDFQAAHPDIKVIRPLPCFSIS